MQWKSEGFALLLQNCFVAKAVLKNNIKQINCNGSCGVCVESGVLSHPPICRFLDLAALPQFPSFQNTDCDIDTHISLKLEWNRIQNVHKCFGCGKHFLPCQRGSKLFFEDKDEISGGREPFYSGRINSLTSRDLGLEERPLI